MSRVSSPDGGDGAWDPESTFLVTPTSITERKSTALRTMVGLSLKFLKENRSQRRIFTFPSTKRIKVNIEKFLVSASVLLTIKLSNVLKYKTVQLV